MSQKQKITPCLWFDEDAVEAAEFYTSVLGGSVVNSNKFGGDKVVTVKIRLDGTDVVLLNGGPRFKFSPAISLFVTCETTTEIDALWSKITAGGDVMMPLDNYEWSDRYGWGVDKFGMTWQLMLGKVSEVGQKIVPCFLFVNEQCGRGEEAIRLWTGLFPESPIDGILHYGAGEPGREGTIKHAQFALSGGKFMVMDGPGEHAFGFNEAFSLIIDCADQTEIDHYWDGLTADGGAESMCGWLKDKFGVSWQAVPSNIAELLSNPAAAQALFRMKRIDIAKLENAG